MIDKELQTFFIPKFVTKTWSKAFWNELKAVLLKSISSQQAVHIEK